MEFLYATENTCARNIRLRIDGNVVTHIEFLDGGCNGNLKALPMILDGWTVEQIEEKLSGITCGRRPTSCADQLTKAVRAAYNKSLEIAR